MIPVAAALCGSLSAPPASSPEWLRPMYHFTRSEHHMNDPNGLMWRRLDNGTVQYREPPPTLTTC